MTRSRSSKKKSKTPAAAVVANPHQTDLALSSLQEQIEALKKDQQWLLKQIKRKRNELSNFVEKMQDIAREMSQRCHPIVRKIMERDREIHQLFAEVFAERKMGKKSLKKVKSIYEYLQEDGIISPNIEETEEDHEDFYEEEVKSRKEISEPPQNQRKMREIFLRLASRFHPDKVTDRETQEQYTAIMQEVNQAYQEGDFAKLLEIERKQHNEDLIVSTTEQESSAEKHLSRLQRDNEILRQQYEEIKQELRYLRRTPEGMTVTDYRRATREGIDPIAEVVAETEKQLDFITKIRDFVRDFRDRKITIQQFLDGPEMGRKLTAEELEFLAREL